jgi:hypothetical protein
MDVEGVEELDQGVCVGELEAAVVVVAEAG